MTKRERLDLSYARAILPHIPRAVALIGARGDDIASAAGLSRYQMQRGVAYIRDQYVVAADVLVTDRKGRYQLTWDHTAIDEWRTRRFLQAQTLLERTYRGAVERVYRQQQAQHPRRVARSKKAYEQLLQDLARLHQAPLF